jgi:DNA polymerase III subunit gamma/tau
MLSSSAFNAFLKTLEEPPPYAIFILATTEKHKILPTILSRCQIFDFKRITLNDTVEHLQDICNKEDVAAEKAALQVIAQKSEGCMRDALSILDKIVSFTNGEVTYHNTLEHLNVLDAGLRQRIDELDLARGRNRPFLELKAFARTLLVNVYGLWQIAHEFLLLTSIVRSLMARALHASAKQEPWARRPLPSKT